MSHLARKAFASALAASCVFIPRLALRFASAEESRRAVVFSDYRGQKPGTLHKITAADLPAPYTTKSVDEGPRLVDRPQGAWPQVPEGFKVQLYASQLEQPRLIRTAPNGDLFVANTDAVIRFPYENGRLKANGPPHLVVPDLPGGGLLRGGGHWTRDIAFSLDGKKMYISVGSRSNNNDTDNNPAEFHRADILEANPDGTALRVFASGIRNAVGIAIHPQSGALWASVNERDDLGDNLPPDYITQVQEGGFYVWPWYYIGGNQDPRHKGKHPELKDKVIVPDVLVQPHNASLEMVFYEASQFPPEYRGSIFAAEHGSWNRAARTGYEVIRVPMKSAKATGEYEDFLTGFVTSEGKVWGRPVGVAVAKDGSLMVSDDGSNSIWRVIYTG